MVNFHSEKGSRKLSPCVVGSPPKNDKFPRCLVHLPLKLITTTMAQHRQKWQNKYVSELNLCKLKRLSSWESTDLLLLQKALILHFWKTSSCVNPVLFHPEPFVSDFPVSQRMDGGRCIRKWRPASIVEGRTHGLQPTETNHTRKEQKRQKGRGIWREIWV